jgi:hypothetical protein
MRPREIASLQPPGFRQFVAFLGTVSGLHWWAAKKAICLRTRHWVAQSAVQSISGGLLDSRRTFAHRIVA